MTLKELRNTLDSLALIYGSEDFEVLIGELPSESLPALEVMTDTGEKVVYIRS